MKTDSQSFNIGSPLNNYLKEDYGVKPLWTDKKSDQPTAYVQEQAASISLLVYIN